MNRNALREDLHERTKTVFYVVVLAAIVLFSMGLYLEFLPEPNPEKLGSFRMKADRISKDSVWVKDRRSEGKWKKVYEVHFLERPIVLSYSNFDFDVHYTVFSENIWKLYRDSTLTVWYKGGLHPSEKYPLKSVLKGSQVARLQAGTLPVYSYPELKAARRQESAMVYKVGGFFCAIGFILYWFAFRQEDPAGL